MTVLNGLTIKPNMIHGPLLNNWEVYPSITEKAAREALKVAKKYIVISEANINILKHCRKSILYHNEELCIKIVLEITSITPFSGAKLSDLLGAYCHTSSKLLLTPVTIDFREMMDWLLWMTKFLEKVIWLGKNYFACSITLDLSWIFKII